MSYIIELRNILQEDFDIAYFMSIDSDNELLWATNPDYGRQYLSLEACQQDCDIIEWNYNEITATPIQL